MRILKDQTAAVLVDVQERLFPHIHEHEQLQRNLLILLKGLRTLEIPALVTEQYTKGLGFTVPELKTETDGLPFIEKTEFSCCDNQDFAHRLRELRREYILLFGIETHVCVLQTSMDLLESGYTPIVVQDCVSSRNLNDKRIAIERMQSSGAIITTYESILFELCRVSGTDTFKAISKLVK